MTDKIQAGLLLVLRAERNRRSETLDEFCEGDFELRRQIEELLPSFESLEDELETPLLLREGALGYASGAVSEGTRVGPYIIERKLGEGGMGVVYLGSRADESFTKQVAIKVVRNPVFSSKSSERFQLERQILANLEHPNIARLLDGGLTLGGVPYLVMEYVRGQPLDRFCKERNLSVHDRIRLFQQICRGVQYAHQHLVIHRDLKPGNVLVTEEGVPFLLDFGVAALVAGDNPENIAPTLTEQPGLTPEYASPEQVRGLRASTGSDVYSLGVILFELLAGSRPYSFPDRSLAGIVSTICDTEPPLPSAVSGDRLLRGDLDAIALRALRKEPDLRYSSVQSLSEDLDRYLDGLPVHAARAGLAYRVAKFSRRNRVAVIAATVVVASLLAGVIGTSWQASVANREREIAQYERARALEEARNANLQRTLVEQSIVREKEQRALAENSAAEARLQRGIAVDARQKADARFDDIRKLSTSFLFEFDSAIANVNGSLKARELVVAKGLEYLEKLSRDSDKSNDLVNEELAAAYERIADIQGNIYQSNLGQFKQAAASYEKALALRRSILTRNPGNASMRLALANSHINLADGLYTSGNLTSAIQNHRVGIQTLEELSSKKDTHAQAAETGLHRSHSRLCTLLVAAGDIDGALRHCEQAQRFSAQILSRSPQDPFRRSNAAAINAGFGTALRAKRNPQAAIRYFEAAAIEYEKLFAEYPQNSGYGRNLAGVYTQLGASWSDAGNKQNGVAFQVKSIDALRKMMKLAPEDARLRMTLGFSSIRLAPVLLALGKPQEALAAGKEGLGIFQKFADRPEATPDDMNNYAAFLLEIGVPSLRDPQTALSYAKRAVAGVRTPNLALIGTLADAFCSTGDWNAAISAAQRGLAENPLQQSTSSAVGLRAELEGKLKSFREQKCN